MGQGPCLCSRLGSRPQRICVPHPRRTAVLPYSNGRCSRAVHGQSWSVLSPLVACRQDHAGKGCGAPHHRGLHTGRGLGVCAEVLGRGVPCAPRPCRSAFFADIACLARAGPQASPQVIQYQSHLGVTDLLPRPKQGSLMRRPDCVSAGSASCHACCALASLHGSHRTAQRPHTLPWL